MSEKVTVKVERNILHLPAIALRGLVVFPNNLLHFEVGRDKSIATVEWAVRNKSEVFLIAQKDMKAEDPKAEEMYQYGVVAEIKQVMRVSRVVLLLISLIGIGIAWNENSVIGGGKVPRQVHRAGYRRQLPAGIGAAGSCAPHQGRGRDRGGGPAPQRKNELRRGAFHESPHQQGRGVCSYLE